MTDTELITRSLTLDAREAALTRREQEFSQRPPVRDTEFDAALRTREMALDARAIVLAEQESAMALVRKTWQADQARVQESSGALAKAREELEIHQASLEVREQAAKALAQAATGSLSIVTTLREECETILRQAREAMDAGSSEVQIARSDGIDRENETSARLMSWEQSLTKREQALTKSLADTDSLTSQTTRLHQEAQKKLDDATALERALMELQETLERQRVIQVKIEEAQLVEADRLVRMAEAQEMQLLRLEKRDRDLKKAEEKAGLVADDSHR